jgi:hypothetical protein
VRGTAERLALYVLLAAAACGGRVLDAPRASGGSGGYADVPENDAPPESPPVAAGGFVVRGTGGSPVRGTGGFVGTGGAKTFPDASPPLDAQPLMDVALPTMDVALPVDALIERAPPRDAPADYALPPADAWTCDGSSCSTLLFASTSYIPDMVFYQGVPYWSDFVSILSLPVTGGTPTTVANNLRGARTVATDGANVYWGYQDGTILEKRIVGGPDVTLATGLPNPIRMAVDATDLYVLGDSGASLWKVSLANGARTTLAPITDRPYALALDATNVYWAGVGALKQLPKTGGAPVTLAVGEPSGVAVDATTVYFTDFQAGTVAAVPIGGGAAVTLVSGLRYPSAVAVDATNVYFVNSSPTDVSLMKVPIGGGAAVVMAVGLTGAPSYVGIDASYVYWSSHDGIRKVAKNAPG